MLVFTNIIEFLYIELVSYKLELINSNRFFVLLMIFYIQDYGIFFFFLINLFIYLFIFGCVGSSFLYEGFLQLRQVAATLHRGARASHCRGLSRCGAQAPDAQAQ